MLRQLLPIHTLALCLLLASCTKQGDPPGTASLIIVNTVVGSQPLVTNFSGTKPITYYTARQLIYKAFNDYNNLFSAYSGLQQLALYQYPDTTEKSNPLFNLTLDLPVGSIHSLFLTGTVNTPDTVFTKDNLPYYAAGDSAMGMRFINLSPGSNPISVNIVGRANGSEAGSLSYKGVTGFRNYPVKMSLADYVFEFRDAGTGTLIASYTTKGINEPGTIIRNLWVYHSFTLALVGTPGGTGNNAPAVFLITHT